MKILPKNERLRSGNRLNLFISSFPFRLSLCFFHFGLSPFRVNRLHDGREGILFSP